MALSETRQYKQINYVLIIIILLFVIHYLYIKRNEPLVVIKKHLDCNINDLKSLSKK